MSRLMAMYSSVLTSALITLISSAPSRDLRLVGISTTPHRSVSSCWLGGVVFHVSKFFHVLMFYIGLLIVRLWFMSDIVLFTDRLYCIHLFSCIAASLFNKLTYLQHMN